MMYSNIGLTYCETLPLNPPLLNALIINIYLLVNQTFLWLCWWAVIIHFIFASKRNYSKWNQNCFAWVSLLHKKPMDPLFCWLHFVLFPIFCIISYFLSWSQINLKKRFICPFCIKFILFLHTAEAKWRRKYFCCFKVQIRFKPKTNGQNPDLSKISKFSKFSEQKKILFSFAYIFLLRFEPKANGQL